MMHDKTKVELYAIAKTLNIAGRSKMDKAQLIVAIEAHQAAMNQAEGSHEIAKAYHDYMFLTKPGSSAERAIIKTVDGVQRYFALCENSYMMLGSTDAYYFVSVVERIFVPAAFAHTYPFTTVSTNDAEQYRAYQEELKTLLIDEILDFIAETKDDGRTYLEFEERLSAEDVENAPVVNAGHTDDVIYQTDQKRVWRSRMTREDGAAYDNEITVEYRDAFTKQFQPVLAYEPVKTKRSV